MVKIKVEKKMNLPELIQWAWNEKRKNEFYTSNLGKKVGFDLGGGVNANHMIIDDDIFTVEVEEEITEETVVPQLVEIRCDSEGDMFPRTTWNEGIACAKDSKSLSFYKVNEDGTLTLLWTKEGGMQ